MPVRVCFNVSLVSWLFQVHIYIVYLTKINGQGLGSFDGTERKKKIEGARGEGLRPEDFHSMALRFRDLFHPFLSQSTFVRIKNGKACDRRK